MPVGEESVSQSHARTSSAVDVLYALYGFVPAEDTLQAMTTDIVACILIRVGDVLTMPGQRERRVGRGGWNSQKGLTT